MGFKQNEQAAFQNFDPRVGAGNKFDPRMNGYNGIDGGEAGSNVGVARPGQKMQISVTLTNNTAAANGFIDIELFNFLHSYTEVQNLTYTQGAYLFLPQNSFEGVQAQIADTDGTVGFDKTGALVIRGLPANPTATVQCGSVPYVSLYKASGITAFKVSYVRFTTSLDAQIDKDIVWFRKTMAGASELNQISPRAYFRPNQFQDLTLDITVEFTIGIDSGIKTQVLNGQRVVLALFIEAWTDQTIGQ